MPFILINKIFFSIFAKIFYMIIVIFLLLDFVFSKTIIKESINKDCLKYTRYLLNEKNFYSYDLKENCRAYETKRTVKTYNVFTDKNGYRIASRNKKMKYGKESIVFLGDSFTYGLGLNYEESVVGLLEEKVTNYNFFNLAVPGYSPLVLKYKLEKFLKSNFGINKIFYLMDLTDVHDESNRWIKMKEFDYPVILDKATHKVIRDDFNLKTNFKMTRLFIYNLNMFFRDIRKIINKKKFEKRDKIIGFTNWGNFTHTPYKNLDKNVWSENDFKVGINNINNNVKLISNMAKEINSDFYIVIFPWPETLEFGEKYFSWQNYAFNLCEYTQCTKLINTFPEFIKKKEQSIYWKKELYQLEDIHFNAKGNNLLSDIIYKQAFQNQ